MKDNKTNKQVFETKFILLILFISIFGIIIVSQCQFFRTTTDIIFRTHGHIQDNNPNKTYDLTITPKNSYYFDNYPKTYRIEIMSNDAHCFKAGMSIKTNYYYVFYIPDYPEQGEEIIFYFDLIEENCTNCINCTFSTYIIDEKNERRYLFENRKLISENPTPLTYHGKTIYVEVKNEDKNETYKFSLPKSSLKEMSKIVIPMINIVFTLKEVVFCLVIPLIIWLKYNWKKYYNIYRKTKDK